MQEVPEETEAAVGFLAPARRLSAGVLAGFLCGLVAGGIGGRIAMFVLRLTSDPSLHGMKTDDDFTIGSFTPESMFLIMAMAFLGVFGGIFYIAIRSRFPTKILPAVMGVFGGAVGGALFVRPGGIDFTQVQPHLLSIVMFIALPAAYGVALVYLAERMLRPGAFLQRSKAWPLGLIPLIAVGLIGARGLALIAAMLALWVVGLKIPAVRRVWASQQAIWAGRLVVAGTTLVAAVMLVQDIVEVL